MIINIRKEDAVFAFIQARYNSQRLPGKVLKYLGEKPLLSWTVDRAKQINPNVRVVVITGDISDNTPIINYCKEQNIEYFQGSEDNVLNRFRKAADFFKAKTVIRLTADNPLIDYKSARALLGIHLIEKSDYSSNKSEVNSGMPVGIGVEIFSMETLIRLDEMKLNNSYREHVNDYILDHQEQFLSYWVCISTNYSDNSFTIDTPDDYNRLYECINNRLPEEVNKSNYWRQIAEK